MKVRVGEATVLSSDEHVASVSGNADAHVPPRDVGELRDLLASLLDDGEEETEFVR